MGLQGANRWLLERSHSPSCPDSKLAQCDQPFPRKKIVNIQKAKHLASQLSMVVYNRAKYRLTKSFKRKAKNKMFIEVWKALISSRNLKSHVQTQDYAQAQDGMRVLKKI